MKNKPLTKSQSQRYETNPFISTASKNTKLGARKIGNKSGDRMMIVNADKQNQYVAPAMFWQYEEVDRTQFLKLYDDGVAAIAGLDRAGHKVWRHISKIIQSNIGKHELYIHFSSIKKDELPEISLTTFHRGMDNLIAQGMLARSYQPHRYFLNLNFVFNGERLAIVKEYRLRPEPKTVDIEEVRPLGFIAQQEQPPNTKPIRRPMLIQRRDK